LKILKKTFPPKVAIFLGNFPKSSLDHVDGDFIFNSKIANFSHTNKITGFPSMKNAVIIMPKEDPQKLVLCLKLNKIVDPQTLELGTSVPDLFIYPWFPLCSLQVPNGFSSGSQYVPQNVLHSTSLLSHMLWQILSSFHHRE
jgi:hypothetical protein